MKYNFLQKSLILVVLLFMGAQAVMAQFTATGRVTDKDGAPLFGATIALVGGGGGAADIDGNYRVQVPGTSGTLVISYTGFKSVTVQVTSTAATADVSLEEDFAGLDEVVVTGFGDKRKTIKPGQRGLVHHQQRTGGYDRSVHH